MWRQKVKNKNDFQFPEKFIYDVQFVEKCLILGALAYFGDLTELGIILLVHN